MGKQRWLRRVDEQLRNTELSPMYQSMTVSVHGTQESAEATILLGIDEISQKVWSALPKHVQGLLIFVHGLEPGEGTVPMQDVYPQADDHIQLVHIVENSQLSSE